MFKEKYNIIGVMSGTSLDGIDLAHIVFTTKDNKWEFEILETQTVSYSPDWLNKLKSAVSFSSEKLTELNEAYTQLLGEVILNFILKNNLNSIDAVCSHGHTILHQPDKGITLQIGNLPQIASIVKQKVVCDFRVQDVALGGQGAPLVPIGDRILFSEYDYCMNLGGFSNLSFELNQERIAFDICPVNTVFNHYSNLLGLPYDNKGAIAKNGSLQINLLKELNELDYYQKKYPKSLGFEFVKEIIIPLIDHYEISIEDKLHTFTKHIAIQIANVLPHKTGTLFITGGGAYHNFLIESIQNELPLATIIIPSPKIIEFKEALIFGILGILRLENKINVLKSVTGAKMNHSSGKIYE
ncbi:anhydro-N-acetylmuramic acid kinase [Flavobacterium sp. FPG59]|jgi:anhydro-N-acetylmuramic acid kinase|uniref:anhydro-N-acetylmuramic acid kinase n=1 Tax=Flavobacterium sp. FPG59 TaxID=1929267 RepID=UPI000A397076|nr:anhydro-N-acetylmuramic acid kinase [Flavobacterium sp. FPG59]OUD36745.1 anhydro-N-acetylmuramic acid kinase [Flavobacterium sp. FPG59]